ncbi:hypothetical protein Nepgr_030081 [Nepenthes gracilis]|uniref:Uncharacterized protein n=1 Tax=Nepenthes gracilis TaxID=150966 RepID=A0AAD3TFQ8_NEPGR|nr:hypothetical protein Nepgr_030081 [Nepenthes gracilis]
MLAAPPAYCLPKKTPPVYPMQRPRQTVSGSAINPHTQVLSNRGIAEEVHRLCSIINSQEWAVPLQQDQQAGQQRQGQKDATQPGETRAISLTFDLPTTQDRKHCLCAGNTTRTAALTSKPCC